MPKWLNAGWTITGSRIVTKSEDFAELEPSLDTPPCKPGDSFCKLIAEPGDIIYTVKGPPGNGTAQVLARTSQNASRVIVASATEGPVLGKATQSGYVIWVEVPISEIPRPKSPVMEAGLNIWMLAGLVVVTLIAISRE